MSKAPGLGRRHQRVRKTWDGSPGWFLFSPSDFRPIPAAASSVELALAKTRRRRRPLHVARAVGFSLVELMIVALLTAILSAAGLELAQGLVDRHRLHSGCEIFVSTVERARSLAVARNGSFEIWIHPSRKSFAVAPAQSEEPVLWRNLPQGVEFLRYPSRNVAFHSRGAAAPAGSFSLSVDNKQIKVIVAVSGRIRWEPVG